MDQQQKPIQQTPLQQQVPIQPEPQHQKMKKIFIIRGIIAVILLTGLGIFYFFSVNSQSSSGQISPSGDTNTFVPPSQATPTPFPFRELTVPYLREREYKSSLGERDVYTNNGSYTSYLTSYDSDGLKINGLLTIPTGEQPEGGFPAIVFVHGYIPPTQYRTTENYAAYVDYLARNGFVVFKIDLRGHGNSEGEPGGGYFGSDYIVDALNARAALQSADFVNPDAIGMWGHSMAGNVLLRSMVSQPDIPAIVIWAGAVYSYEDRDKYGIDDNSYRPPATSTNTRNRRQELMQTYGSPSATSEFWRQVIPTNYLTDIKGAIQLNHAVDDDVVNIGYSRDLNTLLDKTSVVHELYEYQSGGHNISGASFNQAMARTVEFFKKYLGSD